MALEVVEKGCRMDSGKLIVTIKGESPTDVLSHSAKQLAITKAAELGYVNVGINGQTGSYPVDCNGAQHEDWAALSKAGGIKAYQNEFTLIGRI